MIIWLDTCDNNSTRLWNNIWWWWWCCRRWWRRRWWWWTTWGINRSTIIINIEINQNKTRVTPRITITICIISSFKILSKIVVVIMGVTIRSIVLHVLIHLFATIKIRWKWNTIWPNRDILNFVMTIFPLPVPQWWWGMISCFLILVFLMSVTILWKLLFIMHQNTNQNRLAQRTRRWASAETRRRRIRMLLFIRHCQRSNQKLIRSWVDWFRKSWWNHHRSRQMRILFWWWHHQVSSCWRQRWWRSGWWRWSGRVDQRWQVCICSCVFTNHAGKMTSSGTNDEVDIFGGPLRINKTKRGWDQFSAPQEKIIVVLS